jgi:hypothetical protein
LFKAYNTVLALHLIIISCSNVLSFSLHLSGLNTLPAILNSLSTGADVAGIARCFLAKFDRRGNLLLLICQYMRGFSDISVHGSERKYNVIEK